jgi:hypothetical protein
MIRVNPRGLALFAVLALFGVYLQGSVGDPNNQQDTISPPFAVSVVPSWSELPGPRCLTPCRGVSMAGNTLDTFFVILTNVSREKQAVFEPSHSWGYYAVSFQVQTGDGRIIGIKKKQTGFTRNVPSIFLIPPGEQMVYPVKLDGEWEADAGLPSSSTKSFPVRLKAVYQIEPSPESTQQKVWAGRIESTEYHFEFKHWAK